MTPTPPDPLLVDRLRQRLGIQRLAAGDRIWYLRRNRRGIQFRVPGVVLDPAGYGVAIKVRRSDDGDIRVIRVSRHNLEPREGISVFETYSEAAS